MWKTTVARYCGTIIIGQWEIGRWEMGGQCGGPPLVSDQVLAGSRGTLPGPGSFALARGEYNSCARFFVSQSRGLVQSQTNMFHQF